jgi:hypothetical protein
MVCSKIEGKKKLLLHELDFFLIKHLGLRKCNATKPRVLINAYYVNTNNANVTNEKFYTSIGCDIVANLIEKVGKVEKRKNMFNLLQCGIFSTKDVQCLILKISKKIDFF